LGLNRFYFNGSVNKLLVLPKWKNNEYGTFSDYRNLDFTPERITEEF
jgi:hypothetical protein